MDQIFSEAASKDGGPGKDSGQHPALSSLHLELHPENRRFPMPRQDNTAASPELCDAKQVGLDWSCHWYLAVCIELPQEVELLSTQFSLCRWLRTTGPVLRPIPPLK